MNGEDRLPQRKLRLSRREALVAGTVTCFAARSMQASAASAAVPTSGSYAIEREADVVARGKTFYGGKKAMDIYPFVFAHAPRPAQFIVYDLPPGASEGVHVHHLDNRNGLGAFDEYYYIVSGQGVMDIGGEAVEVRGGDHIHTPLDIPHGIENTHATETLKVFITYIERKADNA